MLNVSFVELIASMNETLRMNWITVNPQRSSELLNRTELKETRITSWILPGPLLPWEPTFTMHKGRLHQQVCHATWKSILFQIFFREKKKTTSNRENDICLVLISIIKLRLGFNFFFFLFFLKRFPGRAPMLCRIKTGIKSTLNQKADS